MKKIIPSIFLLSFLAACQSTTSQEPSGYSLKSLHSNDLIANKSSATSYLSEGIPLNSRYAEPPFLFDGDKVLLNEFDFSAWRNKRFLKVEGRSFVPHDRYLIDMRSGRIEQVNKQNDYLEFKDLMQSLVIKLSPLKGIKGTPDILMLTNMVEQGGDASILVIEDPKSPKIHGFIESAIVNAYFSRSFFSVDN